MSDAAANVHADRFFDFKCLESIATAVREKDVRELYIAQGVFRRLLERIATVSESRRHDELRFQADIPENRRYVTFSGPWPTWNTDDVLNVAAMAQQTTDSVADCCARLYEAGVPALVFVARDGWKPPAHVVHGDPFCIPVTEGKKCIEMSSLWRVRLLAMYPEWVRGKLRTTVIALPEMFITDQKKVVTT